MGDGHLMDPTPANPKGHYEDNRFYKLNDKMIGRWFDPVCVPTDEILSEYRSLIQQASKENAVWGMKDPRLCYTLAEVYPIMEDRKDDVRIVAVNRDFMDSIMSIVRRDGIQPPHARVIQCGYLFEREDFLNDHPDLPVLHVSYERMLENPLAVTQMLHEFCAGDIWPHDKVDEAAAFVDPELNHGTVNG